MRCPRCQSTLSTITHDGVKTQVCPECHGEWLVHGELLKIIEHHDRVFTREEIASLDSVNKPVYTAEEEDHDELNCPACDDSPMEHFNYADTSGIILHKCPECEGIWTDKEQLEKIEEVVDGWKDDLNEDVEKYGSILEKIELKEQQELDHTVAISHIGFVNSVLRRFCE